VEYFFNSLNKIPKILVQKNSKNTFKYV
jgi:hypothetical protein